MGSIDQNSSTVPGSPLPPTDQDTHRMPTRTRWRTGCLLALLIIGIICFFIGAIASTSFLLIGTLLGTGGAISLLFSAFQHTHMAQVFDDFIDWLSNLPYLNWAKFIIKPFIVLLSFLVIFTLVAHIPPINDRICQKTFISWGIICGNAFGTVTENVPDALGGSSQVKVGLIDSPSYGPFDMSDQKDAETSIDQKIFAQNQLIAQQPHITLAVITELSRTGDDPSLSANVGLADLKGAYLFQEYYNNSRPAPAIKLRLVIGNIGTRLTADNTVPLIMGRIALLANQDSTFRGILGFPFSGSTIAALHSRNDLSLNQIPIIAPSTSNDNPATSSDSLAEDNFYRLVSPNDTQSCVALNFIVSSLMPALRHTSSQQFRIAVFKDPSDPYSDNLANDLGRAKTGNLDCNSYSKPLSTGNLYLFPEAYTLGQAQQNYKALIDDAIHQQMDLVFFSGYTSDLKNFETVLSQEQSALHYHKRILIVGGDGLYETSGADNTYTTTFTTIYTPPLTGHDSDLEKYFVTNYLAEFGTSSTNPISSGTLFPPHSLEMFDVAHAFTTAIQRRTSIPSQDDFNRSLQTTIDFPGLTGRVQFDGTPTKSPTIGKSDPLNKDIYVMCTNKDTGTAEAALYSPGPTPTITPYLDGPNLLDCIP